MEKCSMTNNSPQDPFSSIPISGPDPGATAIHFKAKSPEDPPPFSRAKTPRQPPLGKKKIFLATLTLGLAAYFFGGFFLLPYLITHQGARYLAARLNRPVTIGAAAFNPATLQLTLKNAIIGPQLSNPDDPVDPLLSFGSLQIDLQWSSLPHRAVICQELSIGQLFIHAVRHPDHTYNLQSLLVGQGEADAPAPFLKALFTRYSISNIQLAAGEIIFEDRPAGRRHTINELALTLPALANIARQSPRLSPHFSAMINGSKVALTNGKTMAADDSVTAQLSLKMSDIALADYSQYLPARLQFKELRGKAAISANLLYSSSAKTPAEQLRLSGTLQADHVTIHDSEDHISTIQGLTLAGWYAPLASKVSLTEMTLQAPRLHLTQTKENLFRSPVISLAQEALSPDEVQTAAFRFTIGDGELTHYDQRTKQQTLWQSIQLAINRGESLKESGSQGAAPAAFSLSGRGPGGARLNCQGTLRAAPFASQGFLVGNHLEAALLLAWLSGTDQPRLTGVIDQLQTEFSFSGAGPQGTFSLTKLLIQGRNLTVAEQNNRNHIAVWQSKNGSYQKGNRTINLGDIEIDKAAFTLDRRPGQEAWSSLLGLNPKDSGTPAPHFQALELRESQLTIDDNLTAPSLHFTLEEINLRATVESLHKPATFRAAAKIQGGAALQSTGTFQFSPFAADLSLHLEALPLQALFKMGPTNKLSGLLTAKGRLSLPELSYQGELELAGFQLSAAHSALKWRTATSTQTTLHRQPFLFKAEEVAIFQPELGITVSEPVAGFLPQLWALFKIPAMPAEQPRVDIGRLRFSEASATYAGPAVDAPFSLGFAELNGTAAPLALPGATPIEVRLTGKIQPAAKLVLASSLKVHDQRPRWLNTQVEGLELAQFKRQLEPVIGHQLLNGRLDIDASSPPKDEAPALRLTTRQLKLGQALARNSQAVPGWRNIPLLQALLTDAEGRMQLELPTAAEAAGPFTMPTFTTHLRKQLLQATVSPPAFLADHLNIDQLPEHLIFAAGMTALTDEHQKILQRLASTLKMRPLLKISLAGYAGPEDLRYLKEQRVDEIDRRVRQHESRLSENLSAAYGSEEIDQPRKKEAVSAELLASRQNIKIADSLLNNLAAQRLARVNDFLLGQGLTDPRLTASNQGYAASPAGRNGARVDLKLEAR